jgi:two-component system chemotaxis response regulator CheB
VIAEDESTCVVYGMPRSVVEAGQANQVVPLPKVASALIEMLE